MLAKGMECSRMSGIQACARVYTLCVSSHNLRAHACAHSSAWWGPCGELSTNTRHPRAHPPARTLACNPARTHAVMRVWHARVTARIHIYAHDAVDDFAR